ncbi:pyridoxal-phosphate dependent enzyme [Candidatus Lucifugimonas marina]|uniref:Pyridoxal-phosphate dependent enzyme n=2 Tax=Candidatus Lucifugimonas marina TaxID=3038979 RepID=A0AAJ5ZF46_9CHLR|nr:pyridoxal-phosphate dependent enzyme [SAR202 cluster bacterium JH702]MDG0869508.1 pyridoxal-phosphate dependent enzyme [SAR202 cluster bacterium JH639]WFG34245.1 pyridoxal-phosphate dependent enzyme [SAR202 cluster bacterium JH545]WFG38175.1 pyridoxal-phosphate dependent enzyme [SAR202 cluster bacterium JH1073]
MGLAPGSKRLNSNTRTHSADKPKTMTVTQDQFRTKLEELPRFKLSHLNTPLEPLDRFKQALIDEGVEVPNRMLVKRDDVTGLAFGGNKGRHFEFEIAHILEGGFDTVININHYHSNQARFIAAGCAKAGLKYHIVSHDSLDAPLTGNLLLCKLMGAKIHRTPLEYARQVADKIFKDETEAGRKPYILPDDPFADVMGMIGFLETGLELEQQLEEADVSGPVRFWGLTGRSIAGLRLYAKNRGLDWQTTACQYSPGEVEDFQQVTADRSSQVAEMFDLEHSLDNDDLQVLSDYRGPAYGEPDDRVIEAIRMVAKAEGLILDPNYTGKAMSGLIGEFRAGRINSEESIVFIHSGGLPQLFAHADKFVD